MFKKSMSRVVAFGLAAALVFTSVSFDSSAASKKKIKSLTLSSPSTVVLAAGKKATVKATVKGTKLKKADKKVTFKVVKGTKAAKKAIKVSKSGKITVAKKAKKGLKVTVKVTTKKISKKTKTKKFTVKVGTPVTKVTATINPTQVKVNGTAQITATVSPKKATVKGVTYKTADKTVATVSSKGVVTGIKAGQTTITVTTKGNNKKAKVVSTKLTVNVVADATTTVVEPGKAFKPTVKFDAATGKTTFSLAGLVDKSGKALTVDSISTAKVTDPKTGKAIQLSAVETTKLVNLYKKSYADAKKEVQSKNGKVTVAGKEATIATTAGKTVVTSASGKTAEITFDDNAQTAKVVYDGETFDVKKNADGSVDVTSSKKTDLSKVLEFVAK